LDARLLPKTAPTGFYTDQEYDYVRAFRVLAHAEIESCLEDLVLDTVATAHTAWKADKKPRSCVAALLAFDEGGAAKIPESLGAAGAVSGVEAKAERAKNAYFNHVKYENHGIREKNVLSLLLPVGFSIKDIDAVWLGTIDAFGISRGETAHASSFKPVVQPDPAQERATVWAILSGLEAVDRRLDSLKKRT
jgi:hypothetical protein